MIDDSRHKAGRSDISVASVSGSFTGCKAVASTTVFSGSLAACAATMGSLSLRFTEALDIRAKEPPYEDGGG